jgi:Kef-type K+ transport system membrane component KefB
MNTRGLVELIALNIGYDLGILSPRIFAMLVIMALVTTCMTGPFLSFADFLRARKSWVTKPA